MSLDETYLDSSNFNNLCKALDFSSTDIDEIKGKMNDLKGKSNFEESIVLIIHNQLLKYRYVPRKKQLGMRKLSCRLNRKYSTCRDELFYQVWIRDQNKWEDIKNKMLAGIESGKINNDYLFEKEYSNELNLIPVSEYENASDMIYLHEVNFLLKGHALHRDVKRFLFKDLCINRPAHPLYFDDLKVKIDEKVKSLSEPIIPFAEFDDNSLNGKCFIVKNDAIMEYVDDVLSRNDESYSSEKSEYLCVYPSLRGSGMLYFALSSCSKSGFKKRQNISNVFIIQEELLEDSRICFFNPNLSYGEIKEHMEWKFGRINKNSLGIQMHDGFNVNIEMDLENGRTLHRFYPLKTKEKADYDHEDLYEIVSQKPLSREFLQLMSSLNMDIDYAYEIQNAAKDENDVLSMINKRILEDDCDLNTQLDKLYTKTILLSKEKSWSEIKKTLNAKIDSGEIATSADLQHAFDEIVPCDYKTNILNAQIYALLDFRELDYSYAEKFAVYVKNNDIFKNEIAVLLNSMTRKRIPEKEYVDDGKYAAPRWLVYPELDAYTIGWRMGYGETYAMNAPMVSRKLFPEPQNWSFNAYDSGFNVIPPLGFFWREDGKPKYSRLTDDAIRVNDFITVKQIDLDFQYNANMFRNIRQAVSFAKNSLFYRLNAIRGFEDSIENDGYWQKFKYSVLLNALYYKFMQDEILKEKLLETGDKRLVYISDDEWGGEDNLFGFALMELRDEIRRLYENENLIDWQYTEYLKHKDPYENPRPRDPEDRQSAEYRIIESTLHSSKRYVRDVNLSNDLAKKYREGQIITEKAFVDATDKIGGLVTSHRYLILSNKMLDLSGFEEKTDWGLHVANAESKFKVLDIYTKMGKTQILLLHLPDAFERVFENRIKIIEEAIGDARALFDECLKEDAIKEVSTPEWLERVQFPLGMNDVGEFF